MASLTVSKKTAVEASLLSPQSGGLLISSTSAHPLFYGVQAVRLWRWGQSAGFFGQAGDSHPLGGPGFKGAAGTVLVTLDLEPPFDTAILFSTPDAGFCFDKTEAI